MKPYPPHGDSIALFVLLVASGTGSLWLPACSTGGVDTGQVCESFCEMMFGLADESNCDFDDDEEPDCREDCVAALEDLREDEREEAASCVECLDDEVGSEPNLEEWGEALHDGCEDECEDDGVEAFLDVMEEELGIFEDCTPPVDIDCDFQEVEECFDAVFACQDDCDSGDDLCHTLCCVEYCDCLDSLDCGDLDECVASCDFT